jgi:two-component system nitrogen regulation response regulator NtrX
LDLLQKNPEFSEKKADSDALGTVQNQELQDIFMLSYNGAKELFEKKYLEFRLAQNDGVISRTAEAIGIYPSNLHTKLRKYGLRTER